jgi:glutamyl-tRNA synthetase
MNVRVRYPPSPTGLQHIGGVRTALFNYFFARVSGGSFILRIEDTDQERFDDRSLQDVYDTFAWLGIGWDEGPDVGGDFGPYVQSERTDLYRQYTQSLLDSGHAYFAYDTAEELQSAREDQDGKGSGYDRRFRDMAEDEKNEYRDQGIKPVVRFKVPLEGSTTFRDAILGKVTWANEDVNPDPVLLKSDGYPTYHLANVVDDHLMEISHILRGQEWIPSAPLHVLIYQALGWDPPEFCHLPMVMGDDGQKLSKRHGATSLLEFRKAGYLPEAIVNYISRLGWSYDDKREIFSKSDLEQLFSLEKINKAPAVFDYKKLEWLNGVYIREMSPQALFDAILPFMQDSGVMTEPPSDDELRILRDAVPLIQERLKYLKDAPVMLEFLYGAPAGYGPDDLLPKKLTAEETLGILRAVAPVVAGIPDLSDDENEQKFREMAEELGTKLGNLLMPVRIAVTGSRVSPPLFGSVRLLGAETATKRIEAAIKLLENSTQHKN